MHTTSTKKVNRDTKFRNYYDSNDNDSVFYTFYHPFSAIFFCIMNSPIQPKRRQSINLHTEIAEMHYFTATDMPNKPNLLNNMEYGLVTGVVMSGIIRNSRFDEILFVGFVFYGRIISKMTQ